MAGDYPKDETTANPAPAFSFNCAQCGSPIQVNAPGQSLTFACRSCSAILQEDSKGNRIITQTSQKSMYKPLFELGAKTDFRGDKWQILGFMVRSDEDEEFFWREYLLFNPYLGYRFLTESDGHWNFMHTTKIVPSVSAQHRRWMGTLYKNYYRGSAKVQFVLGEFYWRIKVGDVVNVQDFIAPPDIISAEIDDSEIVWTAGKYIPPDDIQKSFKLFGPMPVPIGVAPNQPEKFTKIRNQMLLHWLGFAVLIFVIQLAFGSGQKKTLFRTLMLRPTTADNVMRTESFMIEKDKTNIEVTISAALQQNWLEVVGTVVPEDNQGQAFGFQRELARYTYAEAEDNIVQDSADLFFPHLAKGRYHIEFTLSNDQVLGKPYGANSNNPMTNQPLDQQPRWAEGTDQLHVSAVENPPLATPLFIAMLLLSVFPIFAILRDFSFENSRWAQSNQRNHP